MPVNRLEVLAVVGAQCQTRLQMEPGNVSSVTSSNIFPPGFSTRARSCSPGCGSGRCSSNPAADDGVEDAIRVGQPSQVRSDVADAIALHASSSPDQHLLREVESRDEGVRVGALQDKAQIAAIAATGIENALARPRRSKPSGRMSRPPSASWPFSRPVTAVSARQAIVVVSG